MTSQDRDHFYIGVAGEVVCVHKADGEVLWRSALKLPNVDKCLSFQYHPPSVVVEPDGVFAYCVLAEDRRFRRNVRRAVLCSLCPFSGELLWRIELPAGYCTAGSAHQTQAAIEAAQSANQQGDDDMGPLLSSRLD